MIGRVLRHGKHRAEEMREVARKVEEAGSEPLLRDGEQDGSAAGPGLGGGRQSEERSGCKVLVRGRIAPRRG